MKTLFFGTPALAVPFLETLHRLTQVQAVITSPDQPAGRGYALQSPEVKHAADRLGLPVLQPASVKTPEFFETIKAFDADVAIVVAYGKLLPEPLLAVPRFGFLNVHFSLLPAYRGAAPMQWTLINGEQETGVSLFWLDAGMDTGPIFLQKRTPISPDEDGQRLRERLVVVGVQALEEGISELQAGRRVAQPQQSVSSHARILTKEDGRIDWTQPVDAVFNRIRGVTPWPGAFTTLGPAEHPVRLKILGASMIDRKPHAQAKPGQILEMQADQLVIMCGQGRLGLKTVQPEGKKPMDVRSFWLGARLKVGDCLGLSR